MMEQRTSAMFAKTAQGLSRSFILKVLFWNSHSKFQSFQILTSQIFQWFKFDIWRVENLAAFRENLA